MGRRDNNLNGWEMTMASTNGLTVHVDAYLMSMDNNPILCDLGTIVSRLMHAEKKAPHLLIIVGGVLVTTVKTSASAPYPNQDSRYIPQHMQTRCPGLGPCTDYICPCDY